MVKVYINRQNEKKNIETIKIKHRLTTRNIKNWAESSKYEHFNNK